MCDSQVCCWLAAEASPSPPIRSVCSPHTLGEAISSAGLLCAVSGKVNINIYCFIVSNCNYIMRFIMVIIYQLQYKAVTT